ncbi:MAG TPA: lysophospholipid acyltransferase family protein [Nitrospirota bacterium]|nr:lysophospholipid acyltransferase family protein [Nitrospirota bacterium]
MNSRLLRLRKGLTRFLLVWLIRLLQLTAHIVPYRLGVWAGGMLGSIAYHALPRERSRAVAHLAKAYADKDRSWIIGTAKRCFIHLGKSLFEVLMMTPERARRVTVFSGEEEIQKALDEGRGVVVVTGHIGNWELMGQAATAKNYPMSVIAAPLEPQQVSDFIVSVRARSGVRTILRGRPGAAKEIIRVFKENRILGILIDQDTDVEGAFVDFMGSPAWTPTAAASMALKFGAPVLFAFTRREGTCRHRVTVERLSLITTGNVDQDIVMNTAAFTKKIEQSIRACPEQWVWMHRRWRRQHQ